MNAKALHERTYPRAGVPARSGPGHMFLALLAASLLMASCLTDATPRKESPAEAPPGYTDYTGIWEGTLFEATSGNFGEVTLTMHQSGGTVTGTWTAVYPTVVNGGTMSGSAVTGNTLHLILKPSNAYFCPVDVTVYVEFGTHAMGNYASITCTYLQTGIIETWRNVAGSGYNPAPPETPTSFEVAAGAGEVTLQWAHVDLASGYHIYYDTAALNDLTVATKVERVTSPYTLSGLSNGVTYYFVVVSSNMGGESAPSTMRSATPQALAP